MCGMMIAIMSDGSFFAIAFMFVLNICIYIFILFLGANRVKMGYDAIFLGLYDVI